MMDFAAEVKKLEKEKEKKQKSYDSTVKKTQIPNYEQKIKASVRAEFEKKIKALREQLDTMEEQISKLKSLM